MNPIFCPADILLPHQDIDLHKWAVIACDQFTSEPSYWNDVESLVDDQPSTLRMMIPEIYLKADDIEERYLKAAQAMDLYLDQGIFDLYQNSYVYLQRIDSQGRLREGLVGCIDLEKYEYTPGSTTPVRATELTVAERLPARVSVRKRAALELPHIIVFFDDPKDTVMEMVRENCSSDIYDTALMQDGGHIRASLLSPDKYNELTALFDELGADCSILFAIGDGNHSLAAAKLYYETLKERFGAEAVADHPARYAMVELENLHSPAVQFEAIHRIVNNVDPDRMISTMESELGLRFTESYEEDSKDADPIAIYLHGEKQHALIDRKTDLTVKTIQEFLDSYVSQPEDIDYIHGEDSLKELSQSENSIGFLLYPMKKEALFPFVENNGNLPRKTFSTGHARDKRYYMECRKIR